MDYVVCPFCLSFFFIIYCAVGRPAPWPPNGHTSLFSGTVKTVPYKSFFNLRPFL